MATLNEVIANVQREETKPKVMVTQLKDPVEYKNRGSTLDATQAWEY